MSPKKTRPSYLDADECYHLFSSIYFDRHSVSKLLATVIKELKVGLSILTSFQKQRSSIPLQLITAILYLSNLKVNPKIRPTAGVGSLYDKSIVYDNKEVSK